LSAALRRRGNLVEHRERIVAMYYAKWWGWWWLIDKFNVRGKETYWYKHDGYELWRRTIQFILVIGRCTVCSICAHVHCWITKPNGEIEKHSWRAWIMENRIYIYEQVRIYIRANPFPLHFT
jgi:hypothetical protein